MFLIRFLSVISTSLWHEDHKVIEVDLHHENHREEDHHEVETVMADLQKKAEVKCKKIEGKIKTTPSILGVVFILLQIIFNMIPRSCCFSSEMFYFSSREFLNFSVFFYSTFYKSLIFALSGVFHPF
jgi:hypothetical protein